MSDRDNTPCNTSKMNETCFGDAVGKHQLGLVKIQVGGD